MAKRTGPKPTPLADRFWLKVDVRGPDECWPWTGAKSGGYGRVRVNSPRRQVQAHRVAYELTVGPIPDGLVIDHVRARGCTTQLCCNPAHLEPVTVRENLLRGDTMTAIRAAKTQCPAGHPYDEANTYHYKGMRGCLTCRRNQFLAFKARTKSAD